VTKPCSYDTPSSIVNHVVDAVLVCLSVVVIIYKVPPVHSNPVSYPIAYNYHQLTFKYGPGAFIPNKFLAYHFNFGEI